MASEGADARMCCTSTLERMGAWAGGTRGARSGCWACTFRSSTSSRTNIHWNRRNTCNEPAARLVSREGGGAWVVPRASLNFPASMGIRGVQWKLDKRDVQISQRVFRIGYKSHITISGIRPAYTFHYDRRDSSLLRAYAGPIPLNMASLIRS
jgi:hypothetical protein